MLNSMYSGISGLGANQKKLDVIGNNIANSGTTAFKSSSVTFQDSMYQAYKSSSSPSSNLGGINPSKVGMGVAVQSIIANMAQGSLQPTGRPYDVAMDGNGYFVVAKGPFNGQVDVAGDYTTSSDSMEIYYTRDGSFKVDSTGKLVNSNGYRIMGYPVTGTGGGVGTNVKETISGSGGTTPGTISIEGRYNGADDITLTSIQRTDKGDYTIEYTTKGTPTTTCRELISKESIKSNKFEFKGLKIDISKVTPQTDTTKISFTPTTKDLIGIGAEIKDPVGMHPNPLPAAPDVYDKGTPTIKGKYTGDKSEQIKLTYLTSPAPGQWQINGKSLDTVGAKIDGGKISYKGMIIDTKDVDKTKVSSDSFTFDLKPLTSKESPLNGIDSTTCEFIDANSIDIKSDESKLVPLVIPETVMKNGEEIKVQGFSIEKDGLVKAVLADGSTTVLGQVAVAGFANTSGLDQIGQNMYSPSTNSGAAILRSGKGTDRIDNSGAYGSMMQGFLEMSNVDLSLQFTDMIVASRSFQACSKVITTGDEILQELVNLKR